MSDIAQGYRTRRSWLLAEVILGTIAMTIGLTGILPGSRLAASLAESGDQILWVVFFTGFGLGMIGVAWLEACLRARRPLEAAIFVKLAFAREGLHLSLLFSYIYALATVLSGDGIFGLIIMQAVPLMLLHIRGAWEHVKSVEFSRRTEPHPTVVEFARRSLGGGRGARPSS